MLRQSFAALLASSLLLLATRGAHAAEDSGFSTGLRLGYALPLGKLGATSATTDTNHDLSNSVTGKVPIWIDAGYRVNPSIFVGGFFEYGVTFVKDCPSGASCSAHDITFGAQAHFHFLPAAQFDPW